MIYCVEDDNSIRELIIYTLKNTGFEAVGFEKGEELFEKLKQNKPKLIILDVMLPKMDGIEILKKLKTDIDTKKIPVIMLTAKNTEYDKVIGLDNGADDYITKPFGMMELISRIKAVLRRIEPEIDKADVIEIKNVKIDKKSHTILVENENIILTLKEYQLLVLLMENPNIVLTRDVLLEKIWGYDFDGETRTV
ncbi:MAG: response regulator, partial [Oscillospiraceae bacterium]